MKKLLHSARWLLLALLLPLIPASQAHAGVFISVGFAPPILPVYVQPVCPEPGYMWTPGYWGYGDDGYYWVPGAWVPAPYEGGLWTPPYWGYEGAVYVFHPGYWGPHVGYYGGVNYGFGFFGMGFVGGAWHGHEFAYNRAVMRVGEGPRWGGDRVYEDRTVIENHTIVRDSHVSYSGGPGGIRHEPSAEERGYMHEQHMAPSQVQQAHIQAARSDHASYFNANHGQPQHAAVQRPLGNPQARPGGINANAGTRSQFRPQPQNSARPNEQPNPRPQGQERPQYRPQPQPQYQPHPQPQNQAHPQAAPRPEARPESHPQAKPSPKEHEPRR